MDDCYKQYSLRLETVSNHNVGGWLRNRWPSRQRKLDADVSLVVLNSNYCTPTKLLSNATAIFINMSYPGQYII